MNVCHSDDVASQFTINDSLMSPIELNLISRLMVRVYDR